MESNVKKLLKQCRKWTLFGFCLLEILVAIYMLSVGIVELNNQDMKIDTILIVGGVIGILFSIFGIFAAYKETFWLSVSYTALQAMAIAFNLLSAIQINVIFWLSFSVNLLLMNLSIWLVIDINKELTRNPNN